jgi:hypothetical protein
MECRSEPTLRDFSWIEVHAASELYKRKGINFNFEPEILFLTAHVSEGKASTDCCQTSYYNTHSKPQESDLAFPVKTLYFLDKDRAKRVASALRRRQAG